MNYTFPKIETIADVLPHITGRTEFIVADKGDYTVINYVVSMADTFDMVDENDLGGAIRRECRGIKFYPDGRIAARPFHKFFNVNEREETQTHLIDISYPHTIYEKLDGSMLHPMKVNKDIRWMTKMGITDVALQAEEFIFENTKYLDFASWCIVNKLTPLFEWCSRKQKIVIDYPEDKLVLLAVRDNITGKYLSIRS